MKESIGMGLMNVSSDRMNEKIALLNNLPQTTEWYQGPGGTTFMKSLASFCLKCKARNVPASKTVHQDCGGAVLLVSIDFIKSTNAETLATQTSKALEQLEAALVKLETDETYLQSLRDEYKGFAQ